MTEIYQFDSDRFRLGKLCPSGHSYNGSEFSLRYKCGGCVECQKANSRRRSAAGIHAEWTRRDRLTNGRPSRAKNASGIQMPPGLGKGSKLASPLVTELQRVDIQPSAAMVRDMCALHLWLRDYNPPASTADLIKAEQKRHWSENPCDLTTEQLELQRKLRRDQWRLRYQLDPALRAYNREKSKRRKAKMRGGHVIQVTSAQLRERFAQFGNACAYCGTGGDLHIEHVVPIARGGTHTLGNVLPACQHCNYSKRTQDVSVWYRSQPFFSQTRWRRIGQALGWGSGSPAQLTLL